MGKVLWTAESHEGGERDTHWIRILNRISRVNKEEDEITNVRTHANINKTFVNNEPSLLPLNSFSPFPITVIIILRRGIITRLYPRDNTYPTLPIGLNV